MGNPLTYKARKRFGQDRYPTLIPHITHKVTGLYNSTDATFEDIYQIPAVILYF